MPVITDTMRAQNTGHFCWTYYGISGEIHFDTLFKTMIFAMRLNRSHPDIVKDRKWAIQFFFMYGLFSSVFCLLIYCIIFFDLKQRDFTQACSNGTLCIIFSVVTFKNCIIIQYQGLLKDLIDEMRVDYEISKRFPLDEQQIVHKYAKKGKNVVHIWVMISIFGGLLFVVKPLFLMAYYSARGEFKFVHMYELTYPIWIEEVKNEPAVYFLLYAIFFFYDGYAVVMYIGVAPLGPVLMLHGCGQLDLVKTRILNIFRNTNSHKTTLAKLYEIVFHLQKIYSFIGRINESFKILYELILKATVIILPVTLYEIIESFHDGNLRIEFIIFVIGGITISGIPCYYSDKLMELGENVRLAVYMCGWEAHLDQHRKLRSTLLLIHARASRPTAIRTMFRTVSLDALTDVYHQSYAIFNILNAAPR